MPIFQQTSRLGQLTFAAIFAVGMLTAGMAWSTDITLQESDKPVSRLHTLTDRASELAMRAMGMLGIQYKYGGNTPESGLDCSGLVHLIFKEAWDKDVPRTAKELSRTGEHVDKADLKPGDLVFYNTLKRSFSHVGIYLGDHKFIHAPSSGGEVRIESMDIGYWKKRFSGARRISEPEPR
jgi:cell wall-associated NlpC family hydrolase